ncbi:hypothetical protein ACFYOV_25085 [Streptomyces sp. NPDC005931]|uniref:hypothetical protein n=1 Tax=Streptomyces sp. NPDC005931 TaxID=3364737 RepID=UPI0036B39EB6
MPRHDTMSRVTGAALLTLVAVACVAGLADALRRGRGRRVRELARERTGAVKRHGKRRAPAIPAQRRMGPRAESVRLTAAEREAFAGLVRRFGEGG